MAASKTNTDAVLAAFLAAPIAAEAARVIDVNGKRFRDHLRKTHSAYASKGSGWQTMDADARKAVYDYFASRKVTTPSAS